MLDKPASCVGCPMYGDGKGFVPDEWIEGSKVVVLAQNPGVDEERTGRPMVGKTGELMNTSFLPLANLERGVNVSVANVLKCRHVEGARKVDTLPTGVAYHQAVAQCTREHLRVPSHITHVITQGVHATSYAAGRPVPISDWRGHTLTKHGLGPSRQVYAVEHLAHVLRDPKLWWVTELDWRKIDAWTRGDWPLEVPAYLDYDELHWKGGEQWFQDAALSNGVVIDTEYGGTGPGEPGHLTMVGLGYQRSDGSVSGLQIDWRNVEGWLKSRFSKLLGELVSKAPVVFQNFAADMPVLRTNCDIQYSQYKRVDDTMLAHAVLYCELPHSLGFLASIYGQYPKMKHLAEEDPRLYNWGDVLETLSAWEGIKAGLKADPQAKAIYEDQSLALIPILLGAMDKGIKVNKERVLEAVPEYEAKVRQAEALAQAAVGWPINLGSDEQVKYYVYTEQGLPLQVDSETKRPTVSQDALAILRDHIGPEVDTKREQDGVDVEYYIERISRGADPVIEARTLYMEYQHVLDAYLYPLHARVAKAKTDSEAKRARTAAKGTVWTLDDIVDRVHPNFAIHAQKTGRWSTTAPPLAQLPKALRNIICPDPGYVWFSWDWSGIELHLLEAHSGSDVLQKAHNEGMDVHTWTVCAMFGYDFPPNLKDPHKAPENAAWREKYQWKGKDDPRRTFAKSARYEMNYGGRGGTAAEKAVRMGLSKALVKSALDRLLTSDTKYFSWRQRIEALVRSSRLLRTFMGRPRRFLGVSRSSTAVPPKVVREALDYQMQGGVSDVFNSTLTMLHRTFPFLSWSWGMHDSQYHQLPIAQLTQEFVDKAKAIVQRAFTIEGKSKSFPADFHLYTSPGELLPGGITI